MRYLHNNAQSADYLRQAIKRMTQQETALHPLSYAIWYEYVARLNPDLQTAIDARLKECGKLNEEATCALYHQHVAELDAKTALRIGNSVSDLVDQVSASATDASDQASRFGNSLESWSGALGQSAGDLAAGVEDILRGTRAMQKAIGTLQDRLEESSREAQQLKEEVARARQEALIDALTGLVNRKGFDLAMSACLQQPATAHGPCLLMIDLDAFKRINDAHGHVFGDTVLAAVGEILKANVKGKDTAARYGGEEFAVILPQTPRGGALGLAEALRALVAASRIRSSARNGSMIGNISVSIGVADHVASESAADFISRADRALYAAKAQGRNRVVLAARPAAEAFST
ncbi:GGDEF domain-containing protein [Candidatus Accumulibacter sp. ACC003]|uniref:GGDEF domain-containing protein n=1 Tax=Candidatus Accumulibacter sp. ACC003 TaxID=2823334 RepID=UPI0025C17B6D|nr:GGDEF domain-containing protein [Candidatus Accumulibacter sp. ACC003]